MAKEQENVQERVYVKRWHEHQHGVFGGIYGLAFIGAAVYFIQQADGFWLGVLGFLKAIVWPAMLIYRVFTLLGM